jgi:hypothetical protein
MAAAPLNYATPFNSPKQGNGLAIASLVCGLGFFCTPLSALLAIILGIVSLNKTKDPRIGGKGMAIAGIVLGGMQILFVIPLLIAILLPSLNRAREIANRVKCASDMRQIGTAMDLYNNQFTGSYPPDLGTLLKTEQLQATVFACPSSQTSVPGNLTPDQAATWVDANSDYVYAGAGLKLGCDPNTIVLYEKDADHNGDGMNVLFANNQVEFFPLARAHQLIQQSANGNPANPGGP